MSEYHVFHVTTEAHVAERLLRQKVSNEIRVIDGIDPYSRIIKFPKGMLSDLVPWIRYLNWD